LRKVLFAILLVAAAFAGGAAMNGPGLERLKAVVRARLVPLEPPAVASSEPAGPPPEVPAAPRTPLVPEASSWPTATGTRMRPAASPLPSSESPIPVAWPSPSRPEPEGRTRPSAIALPAPPPRSEASPLDLVGPESSPPPPEPRTSDGAVATALRSEAPVRDWLELRRRMRELGVSRYEIDGEPGGRVRVRCLIPLAGRRAVSQQFEGEGDDELQAAESALRRVALWRATEMAPP
jgi:hypothetical protein